MKLNKNVIIFIVFVIFSNIHYASANNEVYCPDDYSNMKPSFSLAAKIDKPVINTGETINIQVYISGYGHVENITKIYASLPTGLVDDGTNFSDIYVFDRKVATVDTSNAFYLNINPFLFKQINQENCHTVLIRSELKDYSSGEGVNPISVVINTSDNAPSGDNKIDLILTYSDGEKWYQDKQEVRFHINSFWETPSGRILIGVLVMIIGYFIIKLASIKSND